LNNYVMQFYLVIECIKQLKMFALGSLNQWMTLAMCPF
jgi:hypothetical protein